MRPLHTPLSYFGQVSTVDALTCIFRWCQSFSDVYSHCMSDAYFTGSSFKRLQSHVPGQGFLPVKYQHHTPFTARGINQRFRPVAQAALAAGGGVTAHNMYTTTWANVADRHLFLVQLAEVLQRASGALKRVIAPVP